MEELRREQNELNDILIKRDSGGGGKLKNVLLMTAALLLVVIIGILSFRIIETGTAEVQREVKAVEETPAAQPKSMFEAAQPAAPEADQARRTLDEMIQRHREAREKEIDAQQMPATSEADRQIPPVPAPPVEEKVMTKEAPKTAVAPKVEEKKPVVTKTEPAKTEAKPAATPKAEAPKPVAKTQPKTTAGGTYFVQVESLSKDPRADYIKQLKDKGYNVVVRDRTVDGKAIKRVYVGPYGTKEEAAAVLPTIRRDFNPEAFIIQD